MGPLNSFDSNNNNNIFQSIFGNTLSNTFDGISQNISENNLPNTVEDISQSILGNNLSNTVEDISQNQSDSSALTTTTTTTTTTTKTSPKRNVAELYEAENNAENDSVSKNTTDNKKQSPPKHTALSPTFQRIGINRSNNGAAATSSNNGAAATSSNNGTAVTQLSNGTAATLPNRRSTRRKLSMEHGYLDRLNQKIEECRFALRQSLNPSLSLESRVKLMPKSASEDCASGTYFLKNESGDRCLVVKPLCQEPGKDFNPKGTPQERDGVPPGQGGIRSHLMSFLQEQLQYDFGIPPTLLTTMAHPMFEDVKNWSANQEITDENFIDLNPTLVSAQLFEKSILVLSDLENDEEDINDKEYQKFVISILGFNTDCNTDNVLITETEKGKGMPELGFKVIDNDYSFPNPMIDQDLKGIKQTDYSYLEKIPKGVFITGELKDKLSQLNPELLIIKIKKELDRISDSLKSDFKRAEISPVISEECFLLFKFNIKLMQSGIKHSVDLRDIAAVQSFRKEFGERPKNPKEPRPVRYFGGEIIQLLDPESEKTCLKKDENDQWCLDDKLLDKRFEEIFDKSNSRISQKAPWVMSN